MRFMKTVRLGAVGLAAAAGLALAAAPANAATTLHSASCSAQTDPNQITTWGFSIIPHCFAGHGDLDTNVYVTAFVPGNYSGYLVYEDGTKQNFSAGNARVDGQFKNVVHIHTN
ncbi:MULTISPECIES: hypothetical protein [Streptomyces]|uniref:Streptomyces killer toxin-like beta/gamma crystallin domain-containing protein n=1 Tax=Streptomyces luteosporeus TaxID=173856 RepID=A0ABP6GDB1_9ACTN